jgi:hypothetical protein
MGTGLTSARIPGSAVTTSATGSLVSSPKSIASGDPE